MSKVRAVWSNKGDGSVEVFVRDKSVGRFEDFAYDSNDASAVCEILDELDRAGAIELERAGDNWYWLVQL